MFLLKEELNLNELSNAVSLWIVWGEGRSKSKRGKNKQRENGAWFLLFAARESERTACSFLEKRVARIPALKRPCGTRGSARISANVEFSKSLFHRSNSLHLFVSRYEFRARRERERGLSELNRKYHSSILETKLASSSSKPNSSCGNGRREMLHGIFPRRVDSADSSFPRNLFRERVRSTGERNSPLAKIYIGDTEGRIIDRDTLFIRGGLSKRRTDANCAATVLFSSPVYGMASMERCEGLIIPIISNRYRTAEVIM